MFIAVRCVYVCLYMCLCMCMCLCLCLCLRSALLSRDSISRFLASLTQVLLGSCPYCVVAMKRHRFCATAFREVVSQCRVL